MNKDNISSGEISGQTNLFVKCFAAFKRTGVIDSPFSQEIFRRLYFVYKRYFEDPFHDLIVRHPTIFHNGHILDIGANAGYTACTFAKAVSPGFKVFAFEPEHNSFSLLVKSIENMQLGEIVCPIQSAVGDKDGAIEIWRNLYHSGDHRTVTDEFRQLIDRRDDQMQSVPIVTIDSFLASNQISQPISFIKVDVQGYELPVCRGMENTLSRNPEAAIAFEYSPDQTRQLGFSEEGLLGFFHTRGFVLSVIDRCGKLLPATEDYLMTQVRKRGYLDILAKRQ